MDRAALTPLVVDLDGTLTPTDTLVESIVKLIKAEPLKALLLPLWLLRGRAEFKRAVSSRVRVAPDLLPYREPLVEFLRAEHAKGRRIILATAAHRNIATSVAGHIGLFNEVLATDAENNLKGGAKLAAIQKYVGSDFVYVGDSKTDLPIWKSAQGGILAGASASVSRAARVATRIEREFASEPAGMSEWIRAIRVHQWLKNLLIFVPLLTAFSFYDATKLKSAVLAFFAFSFAASATYLVNDIWDIENDRSHPRKRQRAIASARIPIVRAMLAALVLMSVALAMAAAVSVSFLIVLLMYVLFTSCYSWSFKRYVLIDVLTLSLLYTLRIFAGSIAIEVKTSSWLLAFSIFVFLSLALVKRCSELVSLDRAGMPATQGRDYRVTDLAVLWPLGVGAGLSSVVVLGLFISAPDTQSRYRTPDLLWLAAVGLIYWLARLWIKTSRGEMHDDPVIYAIKDRGSRIAIAAMVAVTIAAHFFSIRI